LIKDAFSPDRKLFEVTPLQTLQIGTGNLEDYEFLGRVLGKSLYESILVEPQFCLPFLNQLLGNLNTLDDGKNQDPEFYKNLIKIKEMSEYELETMGLTFEYNSTNTSTTHPNIELLPGGASIPVTRNNVILYIHRIAHYRMNIQSQKQTRAFLRGFRNLVPLHWLRLFSASELGKLISGDDAIRGIDVSGLKNIMQYSGGYHPSQHSIQMFWEVLEEMNPRDQRAFLRFVTSCSRQPLLGFEVLNPKPCVHQVRLSAEELVALQRGGVIKRVKLPTASTCMNLLKLPNYGDKAVLKERLLYSINSGAGFELS